MMRKKMMAMMTAVACALSGMAVGTAAADYDYTYNFNVIGIDYAEGTDVPEAYYLMEERRDCEVIVTAEEMERYLTEDSAQPVMGSSLEIWSEGIIGGYVETLHFKEHSWIRTVGAMEETLPLREELVLIKKRDLGLCADYVLKDPDTGVRYYYTEDEQSRFTCPYTMQDAEPGDTITFIMWQYVDPDGKAYTPQLYLPLEVKKGDGTVPDIPEAEETQEYSMMQGTIIAAEYAYGCSVPVQYLIELKGSGEAYMSASPIFKYCDGDIVPGCGDVFEFPVTMIAETYPCQPKLASNVPIRYLGNAADLYGTEEYTVTTNDGNQLLLEDSQGTARYYSYDLLKRGFNLYHSDVSDAQTGEKLEFVLDAKGNPMIPLTEELMATPSAEYAVIAVDDAEDPQNYVLMELDQYNDTIRLTAQVLESCLAPGESKPQFGDVLELTGYVLEYDGPFVYTHDFALQKFGENIGSTSSDGSIRRVGSVFDDYREVEMEYVRTSDRELHICRVKAGDDLAMLHRFDYLTSYCQPDCADLEPLYTGDKINMVVYRNIPVFPAKTVTPLGDVNADNALDLLDVLAVSRHLLVGEPLPALSKTRDAGLGQCDFDGDGAITQLDALNMLKRVIGLA